jgi:hypothetical protein
MLISELPRLHQRASLLASPSWLTTAGAPRARVCLFACAAVSLVQLARGVDQSWQKKQSKRKKRATPCAPCARSEERSFAYKRPLAAPLIARAAVNVRTFREFADHLLPTTPTMVHVYVPLAKHTCMAIPLILYRPRYRVAMAILIASLPVLALHPSVWRVFGIYQPAS